MTVDGAVVALHRQPQHVLGIFRCQLATAAAAASQA